MAGQQDIDVAGTLQNMLDQGFSTNDCAGEEFDNSTGAFAKRIQAHLFTDQNLLIYADNGHGMDRAELKNGFKLNKRTEASNSRQGRYGIGGKQAKVNFTRLQHATVTISKKASNPAVNELEVDWKESVLENTYCNRATGASREHEDLFKKYVLDGLDSDSGTMHIIPCAKDSFNDIRRGVENKSVIKNWLYDFGVKYHDQIVKGVRIEFIIDGVSYTVIPIDPLAFDATDEQHKSREIVEFYRNTMGDLCAWLPERNAYLQEKKKGRGVRTELVEEPLSAEWTFFSRCVIDLTYVENPEVKIAELIAKGFVDGIVSEDAKANIRYEQNATAHLNGVFFNRNDKIINRFENQRPKSGDKARYPYVNKSSCRISFGVEMDAQFSVQVNKSTLKEELIHPSVRRAYRFLHNEFVDAQYAHYKARKAAEESTSEESDTDATESLPEEPVGGANTERARYRMEPTLTAPTAEDLSSHVNVQEQEQVAPECADNTIIHPSVVIQHQRQYVTKTQALHIIEDIRQVVANQYTPYAMGELAKILTFTIGKGGDRLAIMQWQIVGESAGVQCLLNVLRETYLTYTEDNANVIAGSNLLNLLKELTEIDV